MSACKTAYMALQFITLNTGRDTNSLLVHQAGQRVHMPKVDAPAPTHLREHLHPVAVPPHKDDSRYSKHWSALCGTSLIGGLTQKLL